MHWVWSCYMTHVKRKNLKLILKPTNFLWLNFTESTFSGNKHVGLVDSKVKLLCFFLLFNASLESYSTRSYVENWSFVLKMCLENGFWENSMFDDSVFSIDFNFSKYSTCGAYFVNWKNTGMFMLTRFRLDWIGLDWETCNTKVVHCFNFQCGSWLQFIQYYILL